MKYLNFAVFFSFFFLGRIFAEEKVDAVKFPEWKFWVIYAFRSADENKKSAN